MVANLASTEPRPELASFCVPITEHSPWPMATAEGASHVIRYVNPAFCRLFGKAKAELVGKPFGEILLGNDECVVLLDRVLRTGKPESHTQEERTSPNLVFWSYTMWPVIADENPIGVMIHVTETARFHDMAVAMNEALVLGSVRQSELIDAAEELNEKMREEIQERVWAEDALRASEERFRVLFNLGPVAIFSCDRKGIIQNYNRRAIELWGRTPRSGEDGEPFSDLLKVYANGRLLPHAESPIFEVLRGAVVVKDQDVFIEGPDGSQIAAAVTFVPLKDSKGDISGAITAFYDISERRLLEDSLAARAADLARADRSKDEFLAMLAHELRNPLAPLRNAAEILRSTGATPEASAQAQAILTRQIENMSRLVDDLLDVARITEGKIDLRKAAVPLEAIVAAAANLARPGIEARRQELAMTLPAEPVFLEADATRLEQVFGNLLTNASKYSNAGAHISITAERAPVAAGEQAEVAVRVRDDGIGIAPELLPRIFDLFVQATTALDRAYGGLGIGLTLVQRLVKMHGGSVEARSQGLGQGSEFIVRLPVLLGAVAEPPPATVSPAREVPRRILVVDDNEDSARSMCMLQHLRGHETRVAFTGPDALVIATGFAPDVVLLDIGLPGMDGFEVARRLRAMPVLDDTFLVAMTGYGNPDDRALARAAGFDEYLLKPVDLDLLREWMGRRE
jgi:PAS domain S-box-containing protein